ncbi:M20 metallopeptidase family protein [Anaeromicrobium sediminis]|uniref:Amidohydrolase n=1 Tax=Anaeromicrobium sediminis TaxID=1478221 RepID=A0A267MLI1_9FIRM|nr:amidohydrolase [Anaeromicrobium sediminis]PAB60449.1 amidohydrolase [Anaeromicrobium sediminis]
MNKDLILNLSNNIKEELIKIRREIHAYPEPALEEVKTAKLVGDKLEKLGLEVKRNIGITGVTGLLKGHKPGKTILLRADMDCLKMKELNDVEYKSTREGLMHACGHDAHTTWLLGAAMILSQMKEKISGNILFLFQPAEEGPGGADRMIKEGVLDNPKVDAAIGAHVWPNLESGKIGLTYDSMMAAPDKFSIKIYGKGGHGAQPHSTVDPISIGCQIYMSLQTIISRQINPVEPAVLSVTQFNGGSAHNIIPDHVEMVGTVRSLTNEMREFIPASMEKLIKGITEANGGTYEFQYDPYYPPVINDTYMVDIVKEAGEIMLGEDNIHIENVPSMGGEDFSYFQQKVPGGFFVVGTGNEEKGTTNGLHNPYFNIDEDILPQASAVLSEAALLYLDKNKPE